mgnify:CR=1 FL=1
MGLSWWTSLYWNWISILDMVRFDCIPLCHEYRVTLIGSMTATMPHSHKSRLLTHPLRPVLQIAGVLIAIDLFITFCTGKDVYNTIHRLNFLSVSSLKLNGPCDDS